MRVSAETKAATTKRILEVAQKQFAERGFDATTTRDIARAARIATGTLFNYFATKEAIVEALVADAYGRATTEFTCRNESTPDESTLEEDLFAHVALLLRKLKPLRKYISSLLDTALSPLVAGGETSESLRETHMHTVACILERHGHQDATSTIALQLYWTLYVGVLAFWAEDSSPRQEETLALLDQSMAMFVAWLTGPAVQK